MSAILTGDRADAALTAQRAQIDTAEPARLAAACLAGCPLCGSRRVKLYRHDWPGNGAEIGFVCCRCGGDIQVTATERQGRLF